MEVEVPQFTVMAKQLDNDVIVLLLTFTSSGQETQVFLCEVNQNYQDIAKKIHDGICKAGAEGRRHKARHNGNQRESGIVVVKDLPDSMKHGGKL